MTLPKFQPRYSHKSFENEILILSSASETDLKLRRTSTTFHGELNKNYLWADDAGSHYIQRIPIKEAAIIPYVEEDLGESGFLSNGGGYRFRTLQEQAVFIAQCYAAGLPVILPLYVSETEMISSFVPGESYEHYLSRGNTQFVPRVIEHTIMTHKKGFVYSDRWGPNTLIDENADRIYEIDFDIELSGPWMREFELAQVIYHSVHFSSRRNQLVASIGHLLSASPLFISYRQDMFVRFLWGHAEGRKHHAYAGVLADIRSEVDELLTRLNLHKFV